MTSNIYTVLKLGKLKVKNKIFAWKNYYFTEGKQMKTGNSKPFFSWWFKLLMQMIAMNASIQQLTRQ